MHGPHSTQQECKEGTLPIAPNRRDAGGPEREQIVLEVRRQLGALANRVIETINEADDFYHALWDMPVLEDVIRSFCSTGVFPEADVEDSTRIGWSGV